jgi:SUMO ligase MMS21 Smc5/6 complex component
MCPIPGCNRRITREDLQEDEVMADRVRRAKARAEEEHSTQQVKLFMYLYMILY